MNPKFRDIRLEETSWNASATPVDIPSFMRDKVVAVPERIFVIAMHALINHGVHELTQLGKVGIGNGGPWSLRMDSIAGSMGIERAWVRNVDSSTSR